VTSCRIPTPILYSITSNPIPRPFGFGSIFSVLGYLFLGLFSATIASAPALGQSSGCALNSASGQIKHVIYIQFDNVHFRRDNPNVPSDLEQMPHLLNFLKGKGTLLTNHHTPLISHTADDILTSLTGVYPDRHGQAVANGFGFFPLPGTSTFLDGFASSFAYWTDIVNAKTDPTFNMIAANGMNAPAPWVPFTRAGCNVGAISTANIEFENVSSDINNVFGPTSPEAAEAKANFNQAVADFEGIAIHCAAGNAVCSTTNGGEPDVLPQEPKGYSGFSALFGHKFVAPVISPSGPLADLDGTVISDGNGHVGFPGFGGITAAQSLAYVAAMQEHGVPVTYAYISDAHDDHVNDQAFGPGQAGYVAQLASFDDAFKRFFTRLANDGIDRSNTLFVITADEGDHFAGGTPVPANCDGIKVACTYPAGDIGEIDTNLTDLLDKQNPALAATPFDIHFDMAPAFYIKGQPAEGDPTLRGYERASAQLTALDPFTGTTVHLTRYLADGPELKMLHMVTADPNRTPSFVMFGNPDYYFQTFGKTDFAVNPGFAWNHGGVAPEINTTFLGLVGPGVRHKGVDDDVWSDHTDIRPTILLLTGLTDDYSHDGRALIEDLHEDALPDAVRDSVDNFRVLAQVYKRINAPVAKLGLETLELSTKGLAGDDDTYSHIENKLSKLASRRNALAARIIDRLEDAEFHGKPLEWESTHELVREARELLSQVGGDEDDEE
jgi:hypothetical protein